MREELSINKGINKPIEFKGLKAQYIGYLCFGLLGLLFIFAVLYLLGVSIIIVLGITGSVGGFLFTYIAKCSRRYGTDGLMKKAAHKKIPLAIKGGRLRKLL